MCTTNQFCCVCLKSQSTLVNLSDADIDNVKYMDKLIYIVSDLNYTDYSTVQICPTCLGDLKTAYCFKKTCLKNTSTVKKTLDEAKEKSEKSYSQILTNMLQNNIQEYSDFKTKNENSYGQILAGLLTGQNSGQKRDDNDLILLQNMDKNEEKYFKNKNETILLHTIVESNELEDKFEDNFSDRFDEQFDGNFEENETKLDNSIGISTESLLDTSISVLEDSLCEDYSKIPKSNSTEINNQTEEIKKQEIKKEDISEKSTDKPKKVDKLLHYCEFCNKSFTLKMNLTIHMNLHSDSGIQCQHCKIKVPSLAHLKKHVNKHNCQNCSKTCQENKKCYSCKICNKNYSLSSSLKQHMATHETENNYKCKNCNKDISKNLSGCIKLQNSNSFICSVCKINLNTSFDLRQHMNCHEKVSKKYEKNKIVKTQNSYEKTDEQMYDLFI